ncbi:MAG: peroxidase family protein, partial [Steroidobacteraceae bacterium]
EAKDYYQTNADGSFALDANGQVQYDAAKITAFNAANPVATGAPPLLEVTARGELHFNGVDYFFGNTIVMGGTDQADKLLSGNADDDTIWGDGGNDIIDGGGGNDNLFGGKGDDLITDQAGANVVHGDEGNDTILMGKGDDVIFGGDGNDYISAGGGADSVVGGAGNDIVFGGEGADEIQGNQGDDWIEGGPDGGDNLVGDVGAPTGQLPLYTGNDVLIGGVGTVMKGFGGDDIMLGRGGFDKFIGGTGFDWASFERETEGVSVDMKRKEFVSPLNPLAGDGVRDVFTHVEGLSGSQFNDVIRGEDTNKAARILAKDELTNANLVHGLNDLRFAGPDGALNTPDDVFTRTVTVNGNHTVEGNFLPQGPVSFAQGDILLGGGGSDRIEGGGGDDVIDGDAFLHVDLLPNAQGVIGAGSGILREIRYADKTVDDARAVDTAVYQDVAADFTLVGANGTRVVLNNGTIGALNSGASTLASLGITPDAQGFIKIVHTPPIVNGGNAALLPKTIDEGTDLLRNIERLEFADVTVDISAGRNHVPVSALTITGPGAPNVGDLLSSNFGGGTITDADFAGGVITNPISYQWQYQDLLRGEWINLVGATNPAAFTPGQFVEGTAVRLKATYTDARGFVETVTTAPTALLGPDQTTNFGPTQIQRVTDFIPDTSAYQGETVNIFIPITNKFIDDHTASNTLVYSAFIIDAAGVAHDITVGNAGAGPFSGLSFTVQGAPGAVTGATITGTLPVGINGPITVRITANDGGFTVPGGQPNAGQVFPALTATTDFHIDVLNATGPAPATTTLAAGAAPATSRGMGVHFDRVDLDFILTQIKMAEAGQPPVNPHLAFGLRTVSAENNSALAGQDTFGQSDQAFPRLTTPVLGLAQDIPSGFFGPGSPAIPTSYGQTSGFVFDSDPRLISNLIADQSANNPAALAAARSQATVMPAVQDPNKVAATDGFDPKAFDLSITLPDGTHPHAVNYSIPNVTPDGGISAPFNTFFTLFGQFFDHGLDLLNKGGNGQVIIPILPGDPLYVAGGHNNFMVLNRGTMLRRDAGADGIIGTRDDVYTHETTNAVTPPVDLSQVFSSHASHQVFLREYIDDRAAGALTPNFHSTGRMLEHLNADGSHHLPNWADIKLNALTNLGIRLSDPDVASVPLVLADAYGNVVRGPNGYAQVTYQILATDNTTHVTTVVDERTIEGTAAGIDIDHIAIPAGIVAPPNSTLSTQYVGAGVAFINDMDRTANPYDDFGHLRYAADGITPLWNTALLDSHFIAGDGRVNENIGLTSIHDIFLSEFNRLSGQTKALVQEYLDRGDTSMASDWVLPGTDLTTLTAADIAAGRATHLITANEWNGERIFQAARFGAETQYQHLVFEEFARKVAPDIHLSGDTNIHLDPAVFAEFAHTVYRFGHSMLDENLQRFSVQKAFLNPDGTTTDTDTGVVNPKAGTPELGLSFLDASGHPTNNATDASGNANVANPAAGLPVLLDSTGKPVSTDIALLTAFTNPLAYEAAGRDAAAQLTLGDTAQVGNEIDEFVTGTLRNNLLGAPLDLAALNIARGRSEGVPGLNLVRNELYSQTHDSVLKPYDSWHEFGQFLKHPESLINFVAAYGSIITGDAAARRADATILVNAGEDVTSKGSTATITIGGVTITKGDAWDFMHSQGAWQNIPLDANYVLDPRAVHSVLLDPATGQPKLDAAGHPQFDPNPPTYSTGSITGLDKIDFWIGGLAEKQNLHDSMLGSTFDYVFKLQMENLQDADRLYYLPRIEGTDFSDQIENNSFAELIMNNTGVKHLSASVFLTPEYTIEADKFYQHNADGTVAMVTDASGTHAKIDTTVAMPTFTGSDGAQHPLVEIQNDGTVHFLGADNFFGNTMVLGGTAANDRLMAGQADDDTVYGDAGNDIIDGGGGNDNLFGGDGNDILSNSNSSIGTVFHGDAGDDTIYGSKGDDTITGGDGNDLIYGGQGVDDIIGGLGNDIIFGGEGGEEIQGDQGDDWIDGGPDGGDVLFGDVGAPTGGFPLYAGNDVLIGHNGTVMKGFSGDDIMVGTGGFTKFDGGLGFDWASFEIATQGVSIDMNRKEFIAALAPAGGDGIRDLYQLTDAASGSAFDDTILGDNKARVVIAKNSLDNPTLIKGLADAVVGPPGGAPVDPALIFVNGTTKGNFFFAGQDTATVFGGPGATGGFGGGNILLGGAGNDIITGGNGND